MAEIGFRARWQWNAPLEALRRLFVLPRSAWGAMLGHLGVGVMVLGIAGASQRTELIKEMRVGETVELAGYSLKFDSLVKEQGANYNQDVAVFQASQNGSVFAEIRPAKRIYPSRQMPTTEAGIKTIGFSQLYLSVGEVREGGVIVARLYHQPFILLIWIGTLIMSLGGALSLADRRLRIGAPKAAVPRRIDVVPAE